VRGRFLPTGDDHRVTSLELLFDLVFVFAITAVSESIVHRLNLLGLAQGMVVMALIWIGWSAYAWLGQRRSPGVPGGDRLAAARGRLAGNCPGNDALAHLLQCHRRQRGAPAPCLDR
jgi:Bacterial low temperature requirement A protein (LtrA)